MPDLFEEIKEDIQQERLAKLWKDTGKYVIGAIAAIILGTAGNTFYKNHKATKYETFGTKLYSAYKSESVEEGEKSLSVYKELSTHKASGISAIANMRLASLLDSKGKNDEATQLYKDISENSNNPLEIRDLAEILYLKNAIEFSEKKDSSLIDRLQDISESNGPFKFTAKEMLAFILYDNNELKEAKKLFVELSEEEGTPNRMRERVLDMVNAIEIKTEDSNV